MNAGGNPKKSLVGTELIRLLASEGDRVFSEELPLYLNLLLKNTSTYK